MKTTIKTTIVFSSIWVFSGFIMLSNGAQAKSHDEKTETFKQDGMTFVVGKHEPDKRENPKQENEKIIEKVVVKEKIIERTAVPSNQYLEEEKEIGITNQSNKDEGEEEVSTNGIMKFIKDSLSAIEKKIENILTKLGLLEDKVKNVDELIDTTSKITDEVVEQDKRIDKLESALLKNEEQENNGDIESENEELGN